MKGLTDILDEYFIPTAEGGTKQEKYHNAYGKMVGLMYDISALRETGLDDVGDFDDLFDAAMTEEFGYIFSVEDSDDTADCQDIEFNDSEDTADYIHSHYPYIYSSNGKKLGYDDILRKIDDLEPGGLGVNFGNVCVHKDRNW